MTRNRVLSFVFALGAIATLAACHSSTSPSGAGGASINGTLAAGTSTTQSIGHGAKPVGAAAFTGVTVGIVGTSLSTTVDANNNFGFTNVAAGSVQLQFQGNGVSSTVTVTNVQDGDVITLGLVVTGSTVAIGSDTRTNGTVIDDDGIITALGGNQTFTLNGRTVETTPSTTIQEGSLTKTYVDLAVGMQVHITGTLDGTAVAATLVTIENAGSTQPVTITGTVSSVTGTSGSFSFNVGANQIEGDSSTIFTSGSFNGLKNGVNVTVIGQNREGFVQATSIQIG